LNGGTLLAPPPAPDRRIEVIGDSITCGYGNEGTNPCAFTPDTEDHYRTYAAIAARNLQAELYTVAWSGKGVIHNYGDDKDEPFPSLYDRALATDASSSWDFSRFQPHVVVINLGTNDFSTDGDPDEPTFSNAYRTFLRHVREKYPNAQILCLAPTSLGGDDLTRARTYIESVVSGLRTGGDTKIEAHALQYTETGVGCDSHPSLQTHAAMGQALTTKLRSLLGW
jgi:lysophospholipase L1-like esterase